VNHQRIVSVKIVHAAQRKQYIPGYMRTSACQQQSCISYAVGTRISICIYATAAAAKIGIQWNPWNRSLWWPDDQRNFSYIHAGPNSEILHSEIDSLFERNPC